MFDACICVEPDDYAEVYNVDDVKARKEHTCCECGCSIYAGETYERVRLLFEDEWSTYKTCNTCARIRKSLFTCACCHGWMWEDIHEAFCGCDFEKDADGNLISEDEVCICPEVPGDA